MELQGLPHGVADIRREIMSYILLEYITEKRPYA
jgi:hypothetical protein